MGLTKIGLINLGLNLRSRDRKDVNLDSFGPYIPSMDTFQLRKQEKCGDI